MRRHRETAPQRSTIPTIGTLTLILLGLLILITFPITADEQEGSTSDKSGKGSVSVSTKQAPTPYAELLNPGGPLTLFAFGNDASTQVGYLGDSNYEVYPPSTKPADYGTLVVIGEVLFVPDFHHHGVDETATGELKIYTVLSPVSQTSVTGSGTSANPYTITTVVDAGTTGVRISETNSYVVGRESYRTDVTLTNSSAESRSIILYRALDCFLENSDVGYGIQDYTMVGCSVRPENDPEGPGRVEQLVPIHRGNQYYEARYWEVWEAINTQQPFDNTCMCDEAIDNGAGISWQFTLLPGESVTRSHLTVFSPGGIVAVMLGISADDPITTPSATDGYTIAISNQNKIEAVLSSITFTLPDGFTYTNNSTTGLTTANPTINGQDLTWTGPFTVSQWSTATIHIAVTVASAVGHYKASASAEAGDLSVGEIKDAALIKVKQCLLEINAADQFVSEDAGIAQITVSRPGLTLDASVTFSTSDGSASSTGEYIDYIETSQTLSWSAGETGSKVITIPLINDRDVEGPESVLLTLSSETGSCELGDPSAGVLTIEDDDWNVEVKVNTYTTHLQTLPDIGMDATSRSVVVWDSYLQDGSEWGVYGQRYSAQWTPLGTEFRVNTYTVNSQKNATVSMNRLGRFVVVWESVGQDTSGSGIYFQIYDSTGTKVGGEVRANQWVANSQSAPSVAMDDSGKFIIAWQSTNQDGSNEGVYARAFTAAGNPAGPEFRVNQHTTLDQEAPDVATDPAGNYVIVWESIGQVSGGEAVFGRLYDSAGTALSNEFEVSASSLGNHQKPAVAVGGDGVFMVAWQKPYGQDGSGWGIFARAYDLSLTPITDDFQVNTYTDGDQQNVAIAMDDVYGETIVAWTSAGQDGDSDGIYARRFTSDGQQIGNEMRASTYYIDAQHTPGVAISDCGSFAITWASFEQDGSKDGIYMARNTCGSSYYIFIDGFESGNTSRWSKTVGGT